MADGRPQSTEAGFSSLPSAVYTRARS